MVTTKVVLGLLLAVVAEIAVAIPIENFICTEDEHRPRFHFSSGDNWMDVPNGIIYYEEAYHMYYQRNPNTSQSGSGYWGHAISQNLLSWEEVDIAISPNDFGSISSGSVVVDSTNTTGFATGEQSDPIVAVYTNTNEVSQQQGLAYSLDNGMTFTHYSNGVAFTHYSNGVARNMTESDPKVFYSPQDKQWVMLLATGNKIEFYGSSNLKDWNKQNEFATGVELKAPSLFPVNVDITSQTTREVWVLTGSVNANNASEQSGTRYFIGNFVNRTFTRLPSTPNEYFDWGPDNYGGIVIPDSKGQPIFMGWMNNWLYADDTPNNGYRGQLTLPRSIGVKAINVTNNTAESYRLTSEPAPSVEDLRHPLQHSLHNAPFQVISQTEVELETTFSSEMMELEINVTFTDNAQFAICASNEEKEEVCFGFDESRWYLDRSTSGNTKFNNNFDLKSTSFADRRIPFEEKKENEDDEEEDEKHVRIRIFLDVTSMEVFTDEGMTSMTSLHFPSKPFNKFSINHWSPASLDAEVKVMGYQIWGLQCWMAQHDHDSHGGDGDSETTTPDGAISLTPFSIATILLINVVYYLSNHF